MFLKDFIYLFIERGERREKEKERNIDVRETSVGCLLDGLAASCVLACNPSMCPDWESTSDLLVLRLALSTEPHQPGHRVECFGETSNHTGDSTPLHPRFGTL